MRKFSERYGYTAEKSSFQREHVDGALRTHLWNLLKVMAWDHYKFTMPDRYRAPYEMLFKAIWFDFFELDLDKIPSFHTGLYGQSPFLETIKESFMKSEWYVVYDFLQYVSEHGERQDIFSGPDMRGVINRALERHNAAYRFVDEEIIEITDQTEIDAIEEGLNDTEGTNAGVHLDAALRMLSDREQPDYRNSIKEAISAVEAECRQITGKKSATLADALKRVEHVHPALAQAFEKLYAYAGDASGIRHAIKDSPAVTYAEAKFMLVACSSFISYLKLLAETSDD